MPRSSDSRPECGATPTSPRTAPSWASAVKHFVPQRFSTTRGAAAPAAPWRPSSFTSPALKADHNSDPTRPGIRSTLLTVADLDATVTALRDAGITVGGPVDGLISGSKSVLALDPDGVVIELAEAPSDKPGAVFAGIRIAAIDAVATAELPHRDRFR